MSITRQDIIEDLEFRVRHNRISNLKQLDKRCKEEGLDSFDDVLGNMEWNCCDRCQDLYPSEELNWLEYDNDPSEELLRGIAQEKADYCALCDKCVRELVEKGEKK